MGKHYLRLCNCHSDNEVILLQCIEDHFFASPQRMLPKSSSFRCIKIGPEREKTLCCQRNVISYKAGPSGVMSVMDFVPIPFHRDKSLFHSKLRCANPTVIQVKQT